MNVRTIALAIAAASAIPSFAFAQSSWSQWGTGTAVSRTGTVNAVNGSSLTLSDGTTIFLHDGTVLRPNGLTLRPGMRITVDGSTEPSGNINAFEVDLVGARTYYTWNEGVVTGGRFGTITAVDGRTLTLDDGSTILLADGTQVLPRGLILEPGMHVSIYGERSPGGTYIADEIRMARAYGFGNDWPVGTVTARTGTIASVDKSAVTLTDGTVLFLRDGTVITPTGIDLTSGMHIAFTGERTADRNVNASAITVR